MVRPYFAFAAATWSLSPERMPVLLRGYGLFFLAYTEVSDDASLGIRRVERLTQRYRELDYPEDERAASAVASRLLDALRAADRAGTR